MIRCLGEEPPLPTTPVELEEWCNSGLSARPVQEHVGDEGQVLWLNDDCSICVAFDDGDERVLWRGEIEVICINIENEG